MGKRLLPAFVCLTVIAAVASAAEIKTFGTAVGPQYASNGTDGYNVAGLSDDGTLIAVQTTGSAGGLWNVGTDVFSSWAANAAAHGVGTWKGDGTYNTVASIGTKASAANPLVGYWGRGLNGAKVGNTGVLKDNPNTGNFVVPSAFNGVSLDWATGNGWMVGHGSSTQAGKGFVHKIVAGNMTPPVPTATWAQSLGSSATNGGMNGVSNAGVAVGLSSTLGAVLADANNNTAGSVVDIVSFPGADAGSGAAYGVSANATVSGTTNGFVVGYFKKSAWRHGFRLDLTSGTGTAATELLSIDGSYVSGDESEVFDVSNNGIAVGYDLAVGGNKVAAVWLPGATQAVSLESIMNETMPADGSISRLSAIVSITADPNIDGAYTVAGQAMLTAGGSRAFVATLNVPEPATLSLLALGGLFLSRRRR